MYFIVRLAPEPFGGSERILSFDVIAFFITLQQIDIRWSLPGYPPSILCSSPEFTMIDDFPLLDSCRNISSNALENSSEVTMMRENEVQHYMSFSYNNRVIGDTMLWACLLMGVPDGSCCRCLSSASLMV